MTYTKEDLNLLRKGEALAYRYVKSFTSDRDLVKDLVQDFLLTVITDWSNRKTGLAVKRYVYLGVKNSFMNSRSKGRISINSVELEPFMNHTFADPSVSLDLDTIRKAFKPKKDAVEGKVLDYLKRGFSHSQIAKALGIGHRRISEIAQGKSSKESKTDAYQKYFLQGISAEEVAELNNDTPENVRGHFMYIRKKAKKMFPEFA